MDSHPAKPLLIAMAGLPGSGKTHLAERIAPLLPAHILNKDRVRAALFEPGEVEYTSRQDDFVFDLMYRAAAFLLAKERSVILDGRTFTRLDNRRALAAAAQNAGVPLRILYCTCPDEVARRRLEADAARGNHPAADRNFDLYLQRKATLQPIQEPHLEIDTSRPAEECLARALAYLKET